MSDQRPFRLAALAVITVIVAACGGRDAATAPERSAILTASPAFSVGDWRRASPKSPCLTNQQHRQFDFWVGKWDVYVASGDLNGTNNVTVDLDGCAVEEHWIDATGFRGRSLNAYDPATGEWHQHWVTETGMNLVYTGALEAPGKMFMIAAPRFVGGSRFDQRTTWLRESDNLVRQTDEMSTDGSPFSVDWEGFYHRVSSVTPLDAPGFQTCTVRFPVYRSVDWVLGNWSVSEDHGPRLGSSSITTDLSGCLTVERLTTRKGIQTLSYLAYRRAPQDWVRTYVDSEGHWLQLFGGISDGALVQIGTTVQNGNEVLVRVTSRGEASGFRETWEQSTNGGATWKVSDVFVYTAE